MEKCPNCGYELYDEEREDEEETLSFEDYKEQEEERLAEAVSDCTCGAWQFTSNGIKHVADCCCGRGL